MNLLSHTLLLILTTFAISQPHAKSDSNHNTLVFKACAEQKSQNYSQTLSTLFRELVSRSSESKYFKTSEASDEDDTAISGLFQCREDISNEECRNCVKDLPNASTSLCEGAESARVQLRGCYVQYEPDTISAKYSDNEFLHKTCGESNHEIAEGFEEMREAAFSALEEEIAVGFGGFFRTRYELVAAMAQCEGDMEACECGGCVSKAVEIAQQECGTALSGEIYLDKCFLGYSYYPNGVPSSTNLFPGNYDDDDGDKSSDRKIVAIVLGGAAALCFGLVFLLFAKSWTKKDDD